MKKVFTSVAITLVAALGVAACGGAGATAGGTAAAPTDVNPTGVIKAQTISWLLSRPADGSVIQIMSKLATDYAKTHPGFKLNLITTPDRPSYIQKYETLAAANKLPELFDTDATPFAQKLAKAGRIMNATDLLKSFGLYKDYRPSALNYQRFDDGSLYTIPFEYGVELFWYNKALFRKAGVKVPTSLAAFPAMCTALRKSGVTPIALDGQDQWPLERYAAYVPFRAAGPSYVESLKKDQAKFSDPAGVKAADWLSSLGKASCFQSGFSSVGYADAQNLFTSGKAAVYNIGTWELPSLATTKLPAAIRNDVNYFTLPTTPGSVTSANEYVAPSGIGMAVNAKTYTPLVRDFLKFALTRYPAAYAATGAMSPTTNVTTTVPADATPLYQRALTLANTVGPALAMPWDTQLDPTTNTELQQELVVLVQGNVSPKSFASTMDSTLAQNAPKYFK